jgi:hypothetical protein
METTLLGWLVVAAFAVPVGFYSLALLFMGTHPTTGRYGDTSEHFFESPYQPMRMLTARAARVEAPQEHPIEAPAPAVHTPVAA